MNKQGLEDHENARLPPKGTQGRSRTNEEFICYRAQTNHKHFVSCFIIQTMRANEDIDIPEEESSPKDGTYLVAWFRDKRFLGLWTQR